MDKKVNIQLNSILPKTLGATYTSTPPLCDAGYVLKMLCLMPKLR